MLKVITILFSFIWICFAAYFMAVFRAFEMSPWIGLVGRGLLLATISAIIPTAIHCIRTDGAGKRVMSYLAIHAMIPLLVVEGWFLLEEVGFRIDVAQQVESGGEPYLMQQRRAPFRGFLMIYYYGEYDIVD